MLRKTALFGLLLFFGTPAFSDGLTGGSGIVVPGSTPSTATGILFGDGTHVQQTWPFGHPSVNTLNSDGTTVTTGGNASYGAQGLPVGNTGYHNETFGYGTGASLTSGYQNTGMGYDALTSITTGYENSGFGNGACDGVTTGYANTCVGHHTMTLGATGYNNTAIGWGAIGYGSPNNDTAVGYSSLSVDSGGYNSALGYNSCGQVTSGSNNACFGYGSFFSLTTGEFNSALGSAIFQNLTTSSYNTASGYAAGYHATTSFYSSILGYNAGYGSAAYSTTGITLVGAQSGFAIATGADYTTLIGFRSGFGLTSGSRNVLIGPATISASQNQVTTGSNNISIGNDVALASATASNQLNIGNFIFGTGLSGTGSTVSPGKIGFGVESPNETVSIIGGVQHGVVAVASLPTCNAAEEGAHYGVNDAVSPVAFAPVAGGGAVHVPVYCNGSTWVVG